jgi:hypothetical protein
MPDILGQSQQIMTDAPLPCHLCLSPTGFFFKDQNRDYHICNACDLVFVPSPQHISISEEKNRYMEHNNDPGDEGYRNFLRPVAEAVLKNHARSAQGLDFGCGTGSPLSGMLEGHKLKMDIYDPFFARNTEVFRKRYDFLTCTEVIEHLRYPRKDLVRIWDLVKPGGELYIKTQFRLPERDFANWAYIRDLTHVVFYTKQTMAWLADFFSAGLFFPGDGITVLRKRKY